MCKLEDMMGRSIVPICRSVNEPTQVEYKYDQARLLCFLSSLSLTFILQLKLRLARMSLKLDLSSIVERGQS
jgi:hypothetical protein